METFSQSMIYIYQELEVYLPRDARLLTHVLEIIFKWVQIHLSNLMDRQWWSMSEALFPLLARLWERFDYQEVWESTLPPGFILTHPYLYQIHITETAPPPAPAYLWQSTAPELVVESIPDAPSKPWTPP